MTQQNMQEIKNLGKPVQQTDGVSEEEIQFYLTNLIQDIGTQVTRDYESKHGIWEGLSQSNVKTREKYTKQFMGMFEKAITTATQQAVQLERERNYPFRCIVEGIASGAAFSKETGFINQHWIDSAKREIEAFEKFEALSQK